MTQYFFVDESGEPGFHRRSASPYFVLAMVQTPSWAPIDEFAELRRDLHLQPTFEFHYTKMSLPQKYAFYQSVLPILFRVRAAIVLKDRAPHQYRELTGMDMIIELLVNLTLRSSPLDICNDILIIDGATDALRSKLRIRLSQECRKIRRVRPFNKIATASSRVEDGLQLADMVVDAARDKALGNNDAYYWTFASKVVDLWEV
jgi:uncharacterized protein DUF3800